MESIHPSDFCVHVVDDDPDILKYCANIFLTQGLNCATYASGEQFLRTFSAGQVGCVLLDLRLPGIGGLEVVAHLRSAQPKPEIILMSAFETVDSIAPETLNSLLGFLPKPLAETSLLEAIQQAASREGYLLTPFETSANN